ncbi:Gfo/Idh/MocA family protein [Azospirillum halopraeferens]|uniref:Gfo/Idh/MocA family protein n=1 Tax=Azospirillum halopraeferens TaxID=34010 RepID=UPI00040DA6E2|nr:Gfo/Idh/MocA family oxidoreductase [Azospirillum halopraeferens]
MEPVRWGILSTAKIAVEKVIPALQRTDTAVVTAIASRDGDRAAAAAARLGIPRAHGSYEALLEDPAVDAVYIPLPNDRHVPWAIRAAEAGKHVLCEKPVALTAAEAERLIAVRDRTGRQIVEAFMVRHHPQWLRVRALIREGRIGDPMAITCTFSFHNDDPANIRNRVEQGGGALYDIGCYPVMLARWLFGAEPARVTALVERDPACGVDVLTSALLAFPGGRHAGFTVSTRMVPHQRVECTGSRGRIEVLIPFNAPPDAPCRILLDDGSRRGGASALAEDLPAADQYALQADAFARSLRLGTPPDYPLEDAVATLRVIDALFRSGETGAWEPVAPER